MHILKQNSMTAAMRNEEEVDRFDVLSDDIIKVILERLPETTLRDIGKFVCKRWLTIIKHRIFADDANEE